MKKFLLAAACLGATFCTDAYAQFTGGSAGREPNNAPTVTKKTTDKGVFDNAFYIRVGQSSPKGKFGEAPTMSKSAVASFNGEDGSGAQNGVVFELGLISYLREVPLADQYKVGIDASLAFSSNRLDWTTMDENYDNEGTVPMIFAGFKVGPVFSYNIAGKLIADAYFKLNPGISSGPDIYYASSSGTNSYNYSISNSTIVSDGGEPTFSVRKSLGMNLRYSALMLGLEYNYGKVGYTLYESYDSSVNGTTVNSGDNEIEVKMPTSTLLLTVGVKF